MVASLDRSCVVAGQLRAESEMIDADCVGLLSSFLPARLQLADWTLEYSSYEHGISISTMHVHVLSPPRSPPLDLLLFPPPTNARSHASVTRANFLDGSLEIGSAIEIRSVE